MEYREYSPRPRLGAVVDRLWTLDAEAGELAGADQVVLPDGRTELIVHLGASLAERRDERWVRQPRLAIAGQLDGPLLLRPTGRVSVLAVRFRTDGAAALVRGGLHAFTGTVVAVEDVDAPLAAALDAVQDRARSPREAVDLVQDVLERWVDPSRLDARVRFGVQQIRRTHGRLSVDALSTAAGVSRRHLERRFQDVVGLAPKRLARIARFQHARRMLERMGSGQRGALTAAECGYADQAHLIREFREMSGSPPEAHFDGAAGLTEYFVDDRA